MWVPPMYDPETKEDEQDPRYKATPFSADAFRAMCVAMIQDDDVPPLLPTTTLLTAPLGACVTLDLRSHRRGPVCALARYNYGKEQVLYECNNKTCTSFEDLMAEVAMLPRSKREPTAAT